MTKIKNNFQEISAASLIQSGNRSQKNHVEEPGWGLDSDKISFAFEAGTRRFIIWGIYVGKEDAYPFKIDFLKTDAEEITDPQQLAQLSEQEFEINVPYVQNDGRLLFVTNYNKAFFITPPSINSSDVQVRCGCPSYRFAYYRGNKNHQAATGARFPQYVPNGRGTPKPVVAGMCKHLQIIIDKLQESGIIQ